MLATLLSCASCKDADASGTTPAASTTDQVGQNPSGTTSQVNHTVKLNTDLSTMKTVVEKSESVNESFDGYSAVTSGAEVKAYTNIDFSLYDYMGAGSALVDLLSDEEHETYGKYAKSGKIKYYRVDHNKEEEPYRKTDGNTVKGLKCVGAKFKVDTKSGFLLVYYQQVDFKMQSDYSSVEGGTGSFMRISFHTTIPMTMKVNISSTKGDTGDGEIRHNNIVPAKAADGSFVGWAKMTIPYVEKPGDYYINFVDNDGKQCYQSIPIKITEQADERNPDFHLQYSGDWDAITAEGYWDSLTNLFYNTYPRLYQRWANGTEPKIITFVADPTYDGVAYAMGQMVVVSADYANANPSDIGFFSHEITHSVQQFNFWYGEGAWFTENMANYGGFRYHHWSDGKYVQLYQDANQNDLYNWNWGAYGDGSKWFFAYLDYKWPTTLDENGEKVRGLLDTLVYEIKNGRLNGANSNKDDDAKNVNNMFNKIVKEVTGFDCMEDIRKQYEQEFRSGEWDFVGFGNYVDNFLTEDVPYVNNPNYPMVTEKYTGDKTASLLETPVTEGENLMAGATVPKKSGQMNASEGADKLIDGDLTTKWCSTSGSAKDKTYSLDGTRQWIMFDLGETKTFNTYTIYNTKTKEAGFPNMTEWTLAISDDGVNWTIVDYQVDCNENIASFNIGTQSARYLLLRGYTVDNNIGTVRLYEFQLYNQ